MKIGMVLMGTFPPDIRIEKEINSLSKQYEIFILCTSKKNERLEDQYEGVKIKRIPPSLSRSLSQLSIIIRQNSSFWQKTISDFVNDNNIDVLHVHDLPLAEVSYKVASIFKIKFVVDLHENYPAMLKENNRVSLFRVRSLGALCLKLFFSEKKWRNYEIDILTKYNDIICVVEEAKIRLSLLGIKQSKIHVVPNYNLIEDRSLLRSKPAENDVLILLYAGGVDQTRDLETLVGSLTHLKIEANSLKILIVGADSQSKAKLERLAHTLGVQSLLEVFMWLPREKAESIMDEANVGLVPHCKSEHTDTTIPHKIFQYMYRSLPVIVSNCAPLERVVNQSKCGLIYKSGNSLSLAQSIQKLYDEPEKIPNMGESGRNACIELYNWGESEKVLLALYDHLK